MRNNYIYAKIILGDNYVKKIFINFKCNFLNWL